MARVLFITGSLRRDSLNTALSHIAAGLLPAGYEAVFSNLEGIPSYNADVEHTGAPAEVLALREAIGTSDGVFWTVPEYNFGLPGLVKNAIDWASRPVVPQNCVVGKPMNAAVATTSATHGARSLLDLKRYWNQLGGICVPTPDCVINVAPTKILTDGPEPTLIPESLTMVRLAVESLVRFVESGVSEAMVENWRAYVKALRS